MHANDMFAKPITLKFDKKPAFATAPGGICTLTLILLFSVFFVSQMINLVTIDGYVQNLKTR